MIGVDYKGRYGQALDDLGKTLFSFFQLGFLS